VPKALVLINTDPYSAREVLQELKACEDVKECFLVNGAYDVVAKIEGETFDSLVDVINRRVKRLFQVKETLSMMIVDSEGKSRGQENGVIIV
jgi:DNA-binding Lrp family transcriptional regulator